jgi:hypothetical protein
VDRGVRDAETWRQAVRRARGRMRFVMERLGTTGVKCLASLASRSFWLVTG